MTFRKVGHFNWKLLLIRLFGHFEWWGEPGHPNAAYIKRLGNWVYIVSDGEADQAKKNFQEKNK